MENQNIKISVIVPVYNIQEYIDECVSSLVNQTYANLEIILVNDGSTDRSLEKLKIWKDKDERIIIINKKNGGLSSARNAGLNIATGDYISFVDGDDYVDLALYSTVREQIVKNVNLDIITFSIAKFYPNGEIQKLSYNVPSQVFSGVTFFAKSNYYVNAWSKIYRSNFLKKYNLSFTEGILHEDIPFTVSATNLASSILNINDMLYYYRQNREGSILSKKTEKHIYDTLWGISSLFDFSLSNNGSRELNSWLLKRFFNTNYLSTVSIQQLFHMITDVKIREKINRLPERSMFIQLESVAIKQLFNIAVLAMQLKNLTILYMKMAKRSITK